MEHSGARSEPAPFSPAVALVTTARELEARLAGILEPRGLTVRKYVALGIVAATPGIAPADLARRAGLASAGTASVLRPLEELGLVRATPAGRGRPAPLTLTARGAEVLRDVRAQIADLDADAFASPARERLGAALADVAAEAAPAPGLPED